MPTGGYVLVGALGLVLALSAILHFRRQRNATQLGLVLLCIGAYLAAVFHFLWRPGALEAKGTEEGPRFYATVAALIAFVIFGMLAEAMYSWLGKTPAQRRKGFDWAGMIQPLFVSPFILVPTLGAFQNANIDLTRHGFAWLMILLLAFENGFLWRHFWKKPQGMVQSGAKPGKRTG